MMMRRVVKGLQTAIRGKRVDSIFCDLQILKNMAERGGFEPPVEFLTLRRFSKPLLSTTQAPLREVIRPLLPEF